MGRLATHRKTVTADPTVVRDALLKALGQYDWVILSSDNEYLAASLSEIWTEDIDQFTLDYNLQAFLRQREEHTELTLEVWEKQREWTDSECEHKLSEIFEALPRMLRKKETVTRP